MHGITNVGLDHFSRYPIHLKKKYICILDFFVILKTIRTVSMASPK